MYHLIFVCKYRKKLLRVYGEQMKTLLLAIADEYDIGITQMEADIDHIHMLISYSPTKSILEIVRLFKQISTYRIGRQNNNERFLQKHFWSEKTF